MFWMSAKGCLRKRRIPRKLIGKASTTSENLFEICERFGYLARNHTLSTTGSTINSLQTVCC